MDAEVRHLGITKHFGRINGRIFLETEGGAHENSIAELAGGRGMRVVDFCFRWCVD
jgi:hypothetical protein